MQPFFTLVQDSNWKERGAKFVSQCLLRYAWINLQKDTLAAIIFAFSFFLLFVLALPQYDAIKAVKTAAQSRQSLLNDRTAQLNKARDLESQAQARRSDISKIHSFLPERKQVDEIVSGIHAISQEAGLQLVGMTMSDVQAFEDANYKKVAVNIDLASQYPAFVNFLKLLEQSLRLYDVFEINAAASTTVLGSINFSVKMNAYYLK